MEEPAPSAVIGDLLGLAEPVLGDFAADNAEEDTKDLDEEKEDTWTPLPREATLEEQKATFPGEGSYLPEVPLKGNQEAADAEKHLRALGRRLKVGPWPLGPRTGENVHT